MNDLPRRDHPSRTIEAVLFDMNGTLRQRVPDPDWQARALSRLLELLELDQAPEGFLQELQKRYKAYTAWADEHGTCLSETEAWAGWIAPEVPEHLLQEHAEELTVTLRNCRGRTVLKPDAREVLVGLKERGYHLGLISNTPSRRDLPVFIDENRLGDFFEVVVLSSICGLRKPGAAIFQIASEKLGLPASRCAYVGNKASKDIAGARAAGFGQVILIPSPGSQELDHDDPSCRPDQLLAGLAELLQVFPGRA